MLEILGDKLKHRRLYISQFEQGYVVWAPLLWGEFKSFRELSAQHPEIITDIEEEIYDRCVVYTEIPDNDMENYAGIISTLAKQILNISGISNLDSINLHLNEARNQIEDIEEQFKLIICAAFPSYKPEELENLKWPDLLIRVAQAERIIGWQLPELPLRILSSEEQEKELSKTRSEQLRDVNEVLNDPDDPHYQEAVAKLRASRTKTFGNR